MPKIVLDPTESGIEAMAKLFFSATRNMGLSDKEACKALKSSIEAIENAPVEERYAWYGRLNISSCERKQYLIKQRNNMVRTIYERNGKEVHNG